APKGIEGSFVIGPFWTPVSLALQLDGTPLITWPGLSRKTNVARFGSGTTWNVVGTPFGDDGLGLEFSGPVVRVNAAGVVFATAMTKSPTATRPVVFRLDGGDWTALGDPPKTEGPGQDYDLAVDGTGAPVLVVSEQAFHQGPLVLYLYRWSGTAWEMAAPPPPTSMTASSRSPRLAIDRRGRIVLAWTELASQGTGVIR